MTYEEYKEIELTVAGSLNSWFEDFCKSNPEYALIEKTYTKKYMHLNGMQFYAGFSAGAIGQDWKKYSAIPIAIELAMLWAYKTNRIIDHKQEVWDTEENIKTTVLEHDLILSCILRLLETSKASLGENFVVVNEKLLSFLRDIPLGFLIEREKLSTHSLSTEVIKENWEQNYIERNLRFNSLYDFTPLLGYYINTGKNMMDAYSEDVKKEERFSHAGQIINDMSDCTPEYDAHVKSYQDQFADIRNGIITFPIFSLINTVEIEEGLRNPEITKSSEWQEATYNRVKESNLDKDIKEIATASYKKHESFWIEVLGKEDELLMRTYKLLLDNKYFKKFA